MFLHLSIILIFLENVFPSSNILAALVRSPFSCCEPNNNNNIWRPLSNFLSEMIEEIRDVTYMTIIICLINNVWGLKFDEENLTTCYFLRILQKIKPQIYLQIERCSVSKQVFSHCHAENLIREFKHLAPIPVILMFTLITQRKSSGGVL